MNGIGISDYYNSLPRGSKSEFAIEVAQRIGQSASNVELKMRNGRWSKLEIPVVEEIIKARTEQ